MKFYCDDHELRQLNEVAEGQKEQALIFLRREPYKWKKMIELEISVTGEASPKTLFQRFVLLFKKVRGAFVLGLREF